MLEAVGDAVVQQPRKRRDPVAAQVAPDHVPPQGKRQAARTVGPPFAEINDLAQSLVCVGQLSFVNQKARRGRARVHTFLYLIEGHDRVLDRRIVQAQRQERRRQLARHRHLDACERAWAVSLRHDHRTVALVALEVLQACAHHIVLTF